MIQDVEDIEGDMIQGLENFKELIRMLIICQEVIQVLMSIPIDMAMIIGVGILITLSMHCSKEERIDFTITQYLIDDNIWQMMQFKKDTVIKKKVGKSSCIKMIVVNIETKIIEMKSLAIKMKIGMNIIQRIFLRHIVQDLKIRKVKESTI